MGDKKSENKIEALKLLTERMPQRLALMGDEANWAVGLKELRGANKPPVWVRHLILDMFGIPRSRAKRGASSITPADLAGFIGLVSGMATGGRVLFEHPMDTSDFKEEMKPLAGDFQKKVTSKSRSTQNVTNWWVPRQARH